MSDEGGTPPGETPADDPPAEDAAADDEAEGEEGAGDGEEGEGDGEMDLHDLPIGERIAKDPLETGFLVKLPAFITFEHIPRMNDSRSVWK